MALTQRQRYWLEHVQACEASGKSIAEYAAAQEFGAQAMHAGKENLHTVREAPQKYVVFESPWTYLEKAVQGPKFYIDGNSHTYLINRDPNWRAPTETRFSESYIAYIKWILVGKIVVLWHFENPKHA